LERFRVDSLNNRFAPMQSPATDAIFSVDDDLFVSCEALRRIANAWSINPLQMIGVVPRLVVRNTKKGAWHYLRWWHVWWNGAYSLVLTKACMIHRQYLDTYSSAVPVLVQARKHVDMQRNCEDLLMAFIVANATQTPPLWVSAPYIDYGQNILALGSTHKGISANTGHVETRGACLDVFTKLFGIMPLVTGHAMLIDARADWI
jgi:glucuronyl/N-acetylglucosaminyl transferase EXT2